ncbi:MAG: hypothetical protein Salg2KO_09940 [Salibacteraceae bacterium]
MQDNVSASRDIYELIFDTGTEGLIVAGRDGKVRIANERACEIFGYSHEELIELNVDDLLPKHMRAKHTAHREGYAKSPHKRPMGKGYDLIGVKKDGSSVPIEISLNYHGEGEELVVMALIMDVTERKEQEAQIKMLNKNLENRVEKRTRELKESQQLHKSIARNFPNGTINVFDKDLKYILAEGQEMYKLGITGEKLVGKSYINQLPEELRETMEKRLNAVLSGEDQSFEIKHGEEHYLINAVGLLDDSGIINRVLMVEQNISTQKHAEDKVKLALDKERQLNELKSRFVSMASHEFRTPLSTVLSSLALIEKYDEAGVSDKKPKHYQRIRGSVRHLTSILNDFLSLEKVETGKVSINYSEVSMVQLISELSDQLQETAKSGQKIEVSQSGEDVITIDQNVLRVIVTNLLSNAIKYSGPNQRIWLRCDVESDVVKIEVEDEGIGIPEEDQKNMFERFFRAKNALNLEGTGLGLNIVKRYLDMLGGTIELRSTIDKGSTFFITIPR